MSVQLHCTNCMYQSEPGPSRRGERGKFSPGPATFGGGHAVAQKYKVGPTPKCAILKRKIKKKFSKREFSARMFSPGPAVALDVPKANELAVHFSLFREV